MLAFYLVDSTVTPEFEMEKRDLFRRFFLQAVFCLLVVISPVQANPASLKTTIEYIPDEIPVLLDAKRGDIGNTSRLYAKACFEQLGVDAVTIHAYMGTDTVAPFLEYENKAIFVLVKTSNPSAVEFEDIEDKDDKKVYMHMAEKIAAWNHEYPGLAGAVVGATYPEDLIPIRKILPSAPLSDLKI